MCPFFYWLYENLYGKQYEAIKPIKANKLSIEMGFTIRNC